jgi:hypothetical protein
MSPTPNVAGTPPQLPRDRQSEPGATEATRGRAVGLLECGKEGSDAVLVDADAGVANLEPRARSDTGPDR